MTALDPTPEAPRHYPDSYHQQHRNSILFSVATILLCLPDFSIDLDEALFIQSSSPVISSIIPWAAWVAAAYSTLHFYLEWRDYAKPHVLDIVNQLSQVEREMRNISLEIKGIDELAGSAEAITKALRSIDFETMKRRSEEGLSDFRERTASVVADRQSGIDDTIVEMLKRYPAIVSDESLTNRLEATIRKNHAALLDELKESFATERRVWEADVQRVLGFRRSAEALRESIGNFTKKLEVVLREPRWVRRQIDLTRRWIAVRVWVVGFFPPLALCLTASLVFVDSRTGYYVLGPLIGDSPVRQSPH